MSGGGPELDHRGVFVERFALLYAAAGDPPLKRVVESVARARRVDERGRPALVSVQRLSDWRRGRNVPARFSVLAATLEVLIGEARKAHPVPVTDGLYDLTAWRRLWERAQSSPATADDVVDGDPPRSADTGMCPYRGLASFRQEDFDWFFGRERSTAALLDRLTEATHTGGIVILVGASGSGKSSVLRAGVGAALAKGSPLGPKSEHWPVMVTTPGENPLDRLALNIPDLADTLSTAVNEQHDGGNMFASSVRQDVARYVKREFGADTRLVLIVDQFEEIFTLCSDERCRVLFVRAVRAMCTPEEPGAPYRCWASGPTSTASVSTTPKWPKLSRTGRWSSAR